MKLQELRQLIREELELEADESTRMYNQILKRGVTNPPTEPDEFMAYYNLNKHHFEELFYGITKDLKALPKDPSLISNIKSNLRKMQSVATDLLSKAEAHEKGENSIKY